MTFTAQHLTVLISVVSLFAVAGAAEVSGTVAIAHPASARPGNDPQAQAISVALVPAEGQAVRGRASRLNQIEIRGNRMHPEFLTVQQGDRVEFINRDTVFHQLFSLSHGKPVSIQLGKVGGHQASRASFELNAAGTTHFFCKIHNSGYARIDVVDTPYLQTIEPGQSFRFQGLAPGRWRLRIASPVAPTEWFDVTALTEPVPLQLKLVPREGGARRATLQADSAIGRVQR